MRFIQMHEMVSRHDAIGNDIELINKILEKNYESYVFSTLRINENVRYIDEEEFDSMIQDEDTVIIYHHSIYWEAGHQKLKNARCKIIFKYHNITPPEFFEPYHLKLYRLCKAGRNQTNRLIKDFPNAYWLADSKYNASELIGVPEERIGICPPFNKLEVWGNTTEPDADIVRELSESKAINVLFVGRVVPNKGHMMLLEIMRNFCEIYGNDIKLRIVGKFDLSIEVYRNMIFDKIEEYSLGDNIEFIGEVTDASLLAYYKASDVMLICSDHEGFCVPVVEAQYFGLPVIALGKCAVTETVGEDQVILDGDIYKYVAALKKISQNKQYSEYLREKGLENYQKRFSFDKISETFKTELLKWDIQI